MKRILITGSRLWVDRDAIYHAIFNWVADNCPVPEPVIIVHGDASRGADRLARDIAREVPWLDEEPHPADWENSGRAAGFIRNQEMVDTKPDVCLAFIRGESKGTRHCAGQAAKAGVPVVTHVDSEDDLHLD